MSRFGRLLCFLAALASACCFAAAISRTALHTGQQTQTVEVGVEHVAEMVSRTALAMHPFPGQSCTYVSNPMITGVTAVNTSGGTISVTGVNFENPVFTVFSSAWVPLLQLTPMTWTSTTASLAIGAMAAGTYSMGVNNADCSRNTFNGLLSVVAVNNCSSIWGTALTAWYIAGHALCSGSCPGSGPYTGNCSNGGTVTAVCDESGNGNHLAPTGTWTYHSANSTYLMANVATISSSGSSYLSRSAFTIHAGGTGLWLAASLDATTAGDIWGVQNDTYYSRFDNGSGSLFDLTTYYSPGGINAQILNVGTYGVPFILLTGFNGTDISLSFNNQPPVVTVETNIPATGLNFYLGCSSSATNCTTMDFPELCFTNRAQTSPETLSFSQEQNLTYGVTQPPVLNTMHPIQAGVVNAPSNISGSNFENGITFTSSCGNTLTPVKNSAVAAAVTSSSASAATCNITAVNADGRQTTTPNLSTIVSTSTPDPEQIMGASLLMWNEFAPSDMTFNGTQVSGVKDLSGNGNNRLQPTSADQPTTTSTADSAFNNQPSITAPGNPVILPSTVVTSNGSQIASWQFAVIEVVSTTANQFIDVGAVTAFSRAVGMNGAHGTSWFNNLNYGSTASSLSGANYLVSGMDNTGTVNFSTQLNNGTPTTGTLSFSPSYVTTTSDTLFGTAANGNNWTGRMALYLETTTDPTSVTAPDGVTTQLAELHNYVNPRFGSGLSVAGGTHGESGAFLGALFAVAAVLRRARETNDNGEKEREAA